MTSLAAIRERQRSIRLAHLRQGVAPLVGAFPNAKVLLFGSLARGDWDGCSDVDLLAVAPSEGQASALADALLTAGLGDDVIALTHSRWQQLRSGGDPYWAAIGRDAVPLEPL
ncbi:MAG: nucleotidyltransferase domain-containing protein [Cyanobacteria bacterium M_surface_10_m2_179]|nr:nucleotidyltransferase domain-containing protein [Cyanobacteria bacterium M_surface_10_m2_179]